MPGWEAGWAGKGCSGAWMGDGAGVSDAGHGYVGVVDVMVLGWVGSNIPTCCTLNSGKPAQL